MNYKIIFCLFFILCCNQVVITNPPNDLNLSYKINLSRYYNFENQNSATIKWNKYTNNNFLSYSVINSGDEIIISDFNDTTLSIDMNHGEFKKIYFQVNTDQSNITDSIQVFSNIIKPILWDEEPIDWVSPDTNILNWHYPVNNTIEKIEIYRAQSLDQGYRPDINLYSHDPGDEWEFRSYVSNMDTMYVDIKSDSNPMYIYVIKIVDSKNNFRYSSIKRDVSSFTYGLNDKNYILNSNASNDIKSQVYLSWDSYMEDDFYQYLIWRSINNDFDSDSTKTLIATIIDPLTNYFEDRDSIFIGRAYYYQIELMGKYHDKAQKKEKCEGKVGI